MKSIGLSDELHGYLVAHNGPPDPLIAELRAETRATLPDLVALQIAPEQAAFLTFVTRLSGAGTAVEIGTFTGLSSLSIARGLGSGGRLICLDISAEYTAIAQRYWEKAGVADRIELRIGPAIDALRQLPRRPQLDLAFIDADKASYHLYWEEIVPRVRPGGLIAVDNVLRHGRVLDAETTDPDTRAIISFNDLVLADDRIDSIMLPLADGVTLARRC